MRASRIACCPSIRSCRKSCACREGPERNRMITQTSPIEIQSDNYRFLQEHVYSETGIVLEGDKHYLFESRLTPIVRQLGLGSINELCALLRATAKPDVDRQVVEAMTTNETYF